MKPTDEPPYKRSQLNAKCSHWSCCGVPKKTNMKTNQSQTKEHRLLTYMMGWKRGAAGSAFSDQEMRDLDFKRGYDHGKEAKEKVYVWASAHYGAELSPLRVENPDAFLQRAKWDNEPKNKEEADRAAFGRMCLVCGSTMLLPVVRPPDPMWRVHCNHCGSEMHMAVLLNNAAWRI